MNKAILLKLLFLLLTFNTLAQSVADSLDLKLTELYNSSNLPGFAVAVINTEGMLYNKGYGYASVAKKEPYNTQTIHNIGSVSKTFIGIAMMKLVEDGKLDLDTPINELLPFKIVHPKYPNTPITLRHLATHTSGIKDTDKYSFNCYVLKEDPLPYKKNLKLLERFYLNKIKDNKEQALEGFLQDYFIPNGDLYKKKNFSKHQPGTHYEYSNIASAVAAYVVALVSGQDYRDFVKENIFAPLSMNASSLKMDEIDASKHAALHNSELKEFPKYTLVTYPDGGVLSNSEDLATYLSAMYKGFEGNDGIIKSESFEEMMKIQFQGKEDTSGLFWDIKNQERGHNGADPGIFTFIRFYPEANIGILYMTNCSAHEDKRQLADSIKVIKTIYRFGKRM